MASLINFTTLFGVKPANSTLATPVNFRGSENKVVTFNFELEGYRDNFIYNPLGIELKDPSKIKKIAKENPRISVILKEHHLPLKVNMEALQKLYSGHMKETRILVANIFSNLPIELRQGIKGSDLQDAAMLHDYGKVLIPEKIYGKKGSLTPEEKEVMKLHSELGYELLKAQGVRESVCKLVKYHHQNPKGTGYPAIDDDFEYGIASQILAIADKYSALTEYRCYREKPCTSKQALQTIYDEDVTGENKTISLEVYNALKNYVNPQEPQEELELHQDPI